MMLGVRARAQLARCRRAPWTRSFSSPAAPGAGGSGSAENLATAAVVGACYGGALLWVYRDEQEKGAAAPKEDSEVAALATGIEGVLSSLQQIKKRLDTMDEMQRWLAGGCKTGPLLVVGTGGGSSEVFSFRLGPDRATLMPASPPVSMGLNPSFVSASKDGSKVFVAQEGEVAALAVDRGSGKLSPLGTPQSACGKGTCYVEPDAGELHVLAANYVGGSVAVLPVQEDGSVGPASDSKHHDGVFKPALADRQEAAHPHSIRVEPWTGKWALVPDLGKDMCMVYKYEDGKLVGASSDARHYRAREGAGPRHLAFGSSQGKRFVYLLNELDATLSVLRMDTATGSLSEEQVVSLLPWYVKPVRTGHCGSAEVAVHPSGKYLYASNRTDHTLAVFRVDQDSGCLALSGHVPSGGKTPRHFKVSPRGDYLAVANQSSNNLVVFEIDPETGMPAKRSTTPLPASPRCISIIDEE